MLHNLTIILLLTLAKASSLITVSSSSLRAGGTVPQEQVFRGHGCTGSNLSPDLKWTAGPKETKAYAVTVFDPDAPTGHGWWHWIVLNIPPSVTSLERGASGRNIPTGAVEVKNDFGAVGYGGPCPPAGAPAHRYVFTVYAFKEPVSLGKDTPPDKIKAVLENLKIDEGHLEAKYGR